MRQCKRDLVLWSDFLFLKKYHGNASELSQLIFGCPWKIRQYGVYAFLFTHFALEFHWTETIQIPPHQYGKVLTDEKVMQRIGMKRWIIQKEIQVLQQGKLIMYSYIYEVKLFKVECILLVKLYFLMTQSQLQNRGTEYMPTPIVTALKIDHENEHEAA